MAQKSSTSLEHQALLEQIKNEPPFIEFVSGIKSNATKRYYPLALVRYMHFHGFNSTYSMVNKDHKLIQSDISQYITSDNSVKRSTMETYLYVLKTFYIQNDILDINWKKLKSRLGEIQRDNLDHAYTKDQIYKLISYGCTDPHRTKAVILLLASSGMRIGAPSGILLKHMKYYENERLFSFIVYAGSNDQYVTFCSREAADAILEYLRYRHREGESIFETNDQTLTKIIANCSSPLFREQFDKNDKFQVTHPKALKQKTIEHIILNALVRSGLRVTQPMVEGSRHGILRHEIYANHGFRKFFNTTLDNSDVKTLFVEKLMGHKTGLKTNYNRTKETELLKEYLKVEHLLTIDPNAVLTSRIEILEQDKDLLIRKLEIENKKINDRLDKMETSRIVTANDQINEMTEAGAPMEVAQKFANFEQVITDMCDGKNMIEALNRLKTIYWTILKKDLSKEPKDIQEQVMNFMAIEDAKLEELKATEQSKKR